MKIAGEKLPRSITWFLIVSIALTIASVTLAYCATRLINEISLLTPYGYKALDGEGIAESPLVLEPINGILCPGDWLVVQYNVLLDTEKPFVAQIVDTWFSRDSGFSLFETEPEYVIGIGEQIDERRLQVEVPDLAPGRYEYRRAGALPSSGSQPAVIVVPFEIPESCVKE